jgi:ATP-binding cassette, subfamily B, bacterial
MSSTRSRPSAEQPDEKFQLKQVFTSLTTLPRIARLVWAASPSLTCWSALLNLIRGITPAISATITQLLFDGVLAGIHDHTINPIWLPVILQLVVNMLDRIFSRAGSVCQSLLQDRVSDYVEIQVLTKANTLDLAQFEDAEYYDKLRQATQGASYKPASMISQMFELARAIITLVSMLFLLFHLSWWLVLVAVLVPVPSFIANSRYSLRGYWLARRQSPERRLQWYYNHVLTVDHYNKEIKLFNLGELFLERFKQYTEKLYEDSKRLMIPRTLNALLWSILTIVANSAIYLYIALQAVQGRISFGQLSKYVTAANQSGQSFQSVLDGFSNIYEYSLYINQLFEFLEYQPKIVSPANPAPMPASVQNQGMEIEFRNVSFTYAGKEQAALDNVSFKIGVGETVALVGKNGAGKTTLVKLVSRLYDPDEGEILIGGRNVKEYDLQELRENIGVIFQDYARYHMTAHDNVGIGRVSQIEDREFILAAAHKSGADSVIEELSDGYEAMLGRWFKNGIELSGGQWQKIALARAFMRNAPILILDEPTSALDAQAEYEVFTRFRHLTEGRTAIFISHRFSTVRLADRIFVIEHGKMRESGSHAELMELNGRYAELFNLQAKAYR